MNFGFPQFLWALLALSIPLLIHLFNLRRPKTVFFSNTRFLKQLEERSKSIKRFRYWLVLSMRILALSAVILAFTLPYEAGDSAGSEEKSFLHIYLDNSLSMERTGSQGSLFNQARLYSSELLNAMDDQVQVQLITNDFEPRYQRYYSAREVNDLVQEIDYSPEHRSIKELIDRFRNLDRKESSARHHYVLVSDFQSGILPREEIKLSDKESLSLVPLSALQPNQNLAIDSLAFGSPVFVPGLVQEMEIYIRNYSEVTAQDVNLQFLLNDTLQNTQVLDLPAGETGTALFKFSPRKQGSYQAKLSIDKGQPGFDNNFYFSFQTLSSQKVYYLSENKEDYLPFGIFRNQYFDYRKDDPRELDYAFLKDCRLVIIQSDLALSQSQEQQLKEHLKAGKNIWLFPGEKADVYSAQLARLNINIADRWTKDSLMAQVFNAQDPYLEKTFIPSKKAPLLPFSRAYLRNLESTSINLVGASERVPLISRVTRNKGSVFYSLTSAKPDKSNLGEHPIIIPLLANAALFSGQRPRNYLRLGNSGDYQSLEAPRLESALEIKTENGNLIPLQRFENERYELSLPVGEIDPGSYPVLRNGEVLSWISVNSNPKESEMKESEDLNALFDSPIEILDPDSTLDNDILQAGILQESQSLSAWFLAAAILFLLSEMLFLPSKSRSK